MGGRAIGAGGGLPRVTHLSPRTVDAQVRLRSGRDNRGYIGLPGVEKREGEKAARPVDREHIGIKYQSILAEPKVAQI
jgi:hypothetical protein